MPLTLTLVHYIWPSPQSPISCPCPSHTPQPGLVHTLRCLTPLCPPRAYLDVDLTLTQEQMERLSQQIASRVVSVAIQLRHFFLVEDLVDSLKVP